MQIALYVSSRHIVLQVAVAHWIPPAARGPSVIAQATSVCKVPPHPMSSVALVRRVPRMRTSLSRVELAQILYAFPIRIAPLANLKVHHRCLSPIEFVPAARPALHPALQMVAVLVRITQSAPLGPSVQMGSTK